MECGWVKQCLAILQPICVALPCAAMICGLLCFSHPRCALESAVLQSCHSSTSDTSWCPNHARLCPSFSSFRLYGRLLYSEALCVISSCGHAFFLSLDQYEQLQSSAKRVQRTQTHLGSSWLQVFALAGEHICSKVRCHWHCWTFHGSSCSWTVRANKSCQSQSLLSQRLLL